MITFPLDTLSLSIYGRMILQILLKESLLFAQQYFYIMQIILSVFSILNLEIVLYQFTIYPKFFIFFGSTVTFLKIVIHFTLFALFIYR